jgi:hypothetical protein
MSSFIANIKDKATTTDLSSEYSETTEGEDDNYDQNDQQNIDEDDNSSSSYDSDNEKESSSSNKDEGTPRIPMVTNTTINIIRLFGKYIQMLSIFRIISKDVVTYLMQLYNFYFYYIYMHFATHDDLEKPINRDNKDANLVIVFKNIKNELFVESKYNISEPVINATKIVRNKQEYLNCIQERIVAAESL